MKIKTSIMQNMVSNITKVSLMSRHSAVSNLISVKAGEDRLILHTTDIDNHLYVSSFVKGVEEVDITVNQEIFCKLIQKLDTEDFTIIKDKDAVIITSGKSTYKLDIPLDESGNPIELDNLPEPAEWMELDKSIFNKALGNLPACVSTDVTMPALVNYYFGVDAAIATNQIKMSYIKGNLLGVDYLIPPKLFSLMTLFAERDVQFAATKDGLFFKGGGTLIIGLPAAEPITSYPTDAISRLMDTDFTDGTFKIQKQALLKVLDRLSLFVREDERMTIQISTNSNELVIASMSKSGVDAIKVDWVGEPNLNFVASVDISYLSNILSNIVDDNIIISLKDGHSMKIISEGVVNLLSFVEG